MKTADYLAAVRAKLNLTTDYQVTKALRVRASLGYKYLRGDVVPGPIVAFRIAEILGDQPAAVVADLEAERAERTGDEEDLEEWRGWMRRAGGGAASILLALGLVNSPNADATLAAARGNSPSYTSYLPKKKKARPFDGLVRRVMAAARSLRDSLTLTMAPLPLPA